MAAAFQNPTIGLTRSIHDLDIGMGEYFPESITRSTIQEVGIENLTNQVLRIKEALTADPSNIDGVKVELDNIASKLEEYGSYDNTQLFTPLAVKVGESIVSQKVIIRGRLFEEMNNSKILRTGIILTPIIMVFGLLLVSLGFNFGIGISLLSLSFAGFCLFGHHLETGIETINPRIILAMTYGTFFIGLLNFFVNII